MGAKTVHPGSNPQMAHSHDRDQSHERERGMRL